jgi:hypothetical protein
MDHQTSAPSQTASVLDEQAVQMSAYLEDLLFRQIQRLKQYDLEGAIQLAQESGPIADTLSSQKVFERPEFAPQRDRIRQLYQELCLVIASQRQEVQDKLGQIRTGLKTLNTYAQK